jgi:hypothetical protein
MLPRMDIERVPASGTPEITPAIVGPGNGNGIPEYIFTPGFNQLVTAGSGRQFLCQVTPHDIDIFDNAKGTGLATEDDSTFYFFASVDPKHDFKLELNIRNSSPSDPEDKHPDIYPKLLLKRAIDYFEQTATNGEPLTNIEGNWGGEQPGDDPTRSDNWRQYWEYLRSLGPGPYTSEQRVAAASNTWTGKLATELGFVIINPDEVDEREDGNHVVVQFRRPTNRTPGSTAAILPEAA